MLQIAEAQMLRLDRVQQLRFESELVAHLRASFASTLQAHATDEEHLRRIVAAGMERAKTYGITSEYGIRRFLEYALEYWGRFESLSWSAPVLRAVDLAGDEKMDRLDALSLFEVRN
jgi:hypothetical protein